MYRVIIYAKAIVIVNDGQKMGGDPAEWTSPIIKTIEEALATARKLSYDYGLPVWDYSGITALINLKSK